MSLPKKFAAALLATGLVAGLAACAPGGGADGDGEAKLGSESRPVKIGVVGVSDPYWDVYVTAAKDEGISVELVDFADYNQANPALTAGELDLNQFQHLVFLAQHNVASGDDIVPIGSTAVYPLGLYSSKYGSVDEIKDGEQVIVPDDTSNQARALLILQEAGLVTLKDGGSIFSTLDEIESSRVEVTAADASFTATSLADVAAAVVNNDFVVKAGLDPKSALANDDPRGPAAEAYVNVFAARSEDKDNETFKQLVDIYQSTKAVQDGVLEVSGGTAFLVETPAADLEKTLTKLEKDVEAQQ